MKEVDPEVARLLEDLPKSKLPPALDKEGWGRFSIEQMRSAGKVPVRPADEQAPRYMETCVQCGRPITNARRGGGWWDHAGKQDCDGALVAEREFEAHLPQSDLVEAREYATEMRARAENRRRERELKAQQQNASLRATPRVRVKARCSATKHSGMKGSALQHVHECWHPYDHFGFHECRMCSQLWR